MTNGSALAGQPFLPRAYLIVILVEEICYHRFMPRQELLEICHRIAGDPEGGLVDVWDKVVQPFRV